MCRRSPSICPSWGDTDHAKIGVKLFSRFRRIRHFWLAYYLVDSGQVKEAREQLDAGLNLDSQSYRAFLLRACVESTRKRM